MIVVNNVIKSYKEDNFIQVKFCWVINCPFTVSVTKYDCKGEDAVAESLA